MPYLSVHIWLLILFFMGHQTMETSAFYFPENEVNQCAATARDADAELGQFGLYLACERFHSLDVEE